MKEIALIILMFVCLTISGQTISQPNNRYRGSDMLEKKQIEVKDFGLSDTKSVWSLEEVELSEGSFDAEYTTEFMQNGNPIERIPILNGNVIKK